MAHENAGELLDMAPVVALDALAPDERDALNAELAAAGTETAERFAAEVCEIHEALAVMSAATATEPPAELRARLLSAIAAEPRRTEDTSGSHHDSAAQSSPTPPVSLDERRRRGRRSNFLLAAAVAVIVALGGVVVATQWTDSSDRPTAERVMAAGDVRTTTGTIEGGGTATVVFSKEEGAGVLVMNNVAPPAEGTVYQMWLIGPEGPESAGTMTQEDVAPSTTAVLDDLSGATALGFSVEPTGGSPAPTAIFAQLPLD